LGSRWLSAIMQSAIDGYAICDTINRDHVVTQINSI
jgi:hypothetical protein